MGMGEFTVLLYSLLWHWKFPKSGFISFLKCILFFRKCLKYQEAHEFIWNLTFLGHKWASLETSPVKNDPSNKWGLRPWSPRGPLAWGVGRETLLPRNLLARSRPVRNSGGLGSHVPTSSVPVAEAWEALEGADPEAADAGAVPGHPAPGAGAGKTTWAVERRWCSYWRVRVEFKGPDQQLEESTNV